MIKLNLKHQPLTVSYAPQSDPRPAHRLMVPIPNPEADLNAVAHRVWELASATGADVKFLGLCNDATQEPSLRRMLVTITAMVNDDNVYAESEVIYGRDWVGAIKSRVQPGDTVVCWYEKETGLLQKTIGPILQRDLNVPIYLLSGVQQKEVSHSNWLTQLTAWIGFLAILIGFFFLQVKIEHLAQAGTTILQLFALAVEFSLIWFWNNLFK